MDEGTRRTIQEVLATQQFGVLVTQDAGRLHTSTVHFAETPELELICAIQPTTLKARQAESNPRAAFQVDNRGVLLESRDRFVRIGFEGTLRRVPEDDPEHERLSRTYVQKLPVGQRLLESPQVSLYILQPSLIRFAAGAAAPEDFPIVHEEPPPPPAEPADDLWAAPPETAAMPEAPSWPPAEPPPAGL